MLTPSRKSLLLVEALVCFAPMAFTLFFGVLVFPIWVGMLFTYWAGFVTPAPDGQGMPWAVIWPMALVLCGVAGLLGLARVLGIVFSGNPNPRWPVLTLVLMLLGALAVVVFYVFAAPSPLAEPIQFLLLFALPVAGIAHFTYLVRHTVVLPAIEELLT